MMAGLFNCDLEVICECTYTEARADCVMQL